MQIEDPQQDPFEMDEQLSSGEEVKQRSSIFTQFINAPPKDCLELIAKLMGDSDTYRSFRSSITELNSIVFSNFIEKFNNKVAEIIGLLIADARDKKHIQPSLNTVITFKNVLKFLKTVYYKDGIVTQNQNLYNLLTELVSSLDEFDFFGRALETSNFIISRDQKKHEKYIKEIIWPLYIWLKKSEVKPKIAIGDKLDKLKQQERSLLYFQVIRCMSSSKVPELQPTEDECQQIIQTLRVKPHRRLLLLAIRYRKMHELCDRIVDELLGCSMVKGEGNQIGYQFRKNYLHEDLHRPETILVALQETGPEYIRFFNSQAFIVTENCIYSKFDVKMLDEFQKKAKMETGSFEMDVIYGIGENFKKLIENSNKPLRIVRQGNQMQTEENIYPQVLSKVFCIMTQYITSYIAEFNTISVQGLLTEKIHEQFLTLISKWTDEQRIANSEYMKSVRECLLIFTFFLSFRRSFQGVVTWDSNLSNLLFTIIDKSTSFKRSWNTVKNFKNLLNRWVDTVPNDDQRFRKMFQKFFTILFDPKLAVPNKGPSLFSSLKLTRANIKVVGEQIVKRLTQLRDRMLSKQNQKQETTDGTQNEMMMQKILMIANSRHKNDVDKAGQLFGELYENYAKQLPSLYHFRNYITEIYKKKEERVTIVASRADAFIESFNRIQQQLAKLSIKDWLLPVSKISDLKTKKQIEQSLVLGQKLTSTLELKNPTINYSEKMYSSLVKTISEGYLLVILFQTKITAELKAQPEKMQELFVESSLPGKKASLFTELKDVFEELKNVIRFYLCNPEKTLTKNEQHYLVKEIGEQVFLEIEKYQQKPEQLVVSNFKNSMILLTLVNDVFGLNKLTCKSHIQKEQISKLDPMQREREHQHQITPMRSRQMVPLNILSSLYSSDKVHAKFFTILSILFEKSRKIKLVKEKGDPTFKFQFRLASEVDILILLDEFLTKRKQKKEMTEEDVKTEIEQNTSLLQKQVENFIDYFFLAATRTSNGVWLNNQFVSSAEQEIAMGIYLDQINAMQTKMTAKDIILLEKNFEQFVDNLTNKKLLVKRNEQDLQNVGNPFGRRMSGRLGRPRNSNQHIRQQLLNMHYPPEIVDVVVDNNEFGETAEALEWIDQNEHRLDQLLIQRITQQGTRSSQQSGVNNSNEPKREQSYTGQKVVPIKSAEFASEFDRNMRTLIKNVLLPNIFTEEGEAVKNMLFVCIGAFADNSFRSRQYVFFAVKMFTHLDQIKDLTQSEEKIKLKVILGILDNGINKQPNVIIKFLAGNIGVKLLNMLPQVEEEQGDLILKIVSNTLPVLSDKQKNPSSESMKNYMAFICDVLLRSEVRSNYLSEILYKIAITEDADLLPKVTKVVRSSLSKGCIKSHLFPLISLLIESDKKFVEANMELDIKGFILDNFPYKDKNSEGKELTIEIDSRTFATGLKKYEGKAKFIDVSKRLLTKKKNKSRFLYYSFRDHDLLSNETLGVNILQVEHSQIIRVIIDGILALITNFKEAKKKEVDDKKQTGGVQYYVKELQKILDYYPLLIPFTCTREIQNSGSFLAWLVSSYTVTTAGAGLGFIEFLMMSNNLFINVGKDKQKVEISPFSEYVVTQILSTLTINNTKFSDKVTFDKFWSTFLIMYFSQVKSFNQKAKSPFSTDNKTSLKDVLQNSISKITLESEQSKQNEFECNPIVYALRCQCLYLIHKWEMIRSLSKGKYKLIEGGQTEIQKQYLPMDLFYGNDIVEQWKSGVAGNHSRVLRDPLTQSRQVSGGHRIVMLRDGQIRLGMGLAAGEEEELEEDLEVDEEEDEQNMDINRIHLHPRHSLPTNDFSEAQRNIINIFQPIQPPREPQQQQQHRPRTQSENIRVQSEQQQNEPQVERIPPEIPIQHPVNPVQEPESEMKDQSQEALIPLKEGKDKKVQNQKNEQEDQNNEINEQQVAEPTYLLDILNTFSRLFPTYKQSEPKKQEIMEEIRIPEEPIKIEPVPSCKLTINEPYTVSDMASQKTKIFQQRISQIYSLLYAKKSWQIPGQKQKKKLALRLGDAYLDGRLRELGGQMMMQIERLLNRRQLEEEMQQNRARPMNIGQLMGRLDQYVEPIIDEPIFQRQQQQSMVAESTEKKQQPKKMDIEIQKKQQKVDQPKKQNQKQGKMDEQVKPQQKKQEEPIDKSLVEQKQRQKPEQKQEQQKDDLIAQQEPSDEKREKVQGQNKQQGEKKQQIKPQEQIVEQQQGNMVPEPPLVQRQVLAMMGLPQTFLHDMAIDAELFDSLPEDLQMEQITNIMRDQERMRPQNQNNPRNVNHPPMSDPMSDNAAFFASVDPALRAQLLLEATPEVLATLPPEMRVQAENARQQQIARMLQEEQLEEENNVYGNKRVNVDQRNLKFPDVPAKLFPRVSETLPDKLIKTVFISITSSQNNKFKIMGYRFLLENKSTRDKALTTLISILRQEHFGHNQQMLHCSVQDSKQPLQENSLNKWVFENKQISNDIKKFRENILRLIFETVKTCPYRDQKYLQKRLPSQGYANYKVPKNQNQSHIVNQNSDTYDPQLELMDLGIIYYPPMASQIMRRLNEDKKDLNLPNYILDKIVSSVKRDKLPADFYDNLEKLSQSPQMKRLFEKYFPETSPPKIDLLANLLKYKFAQLSYLSTIHEQAISSYSPNYNEFLNQIFRIYTLADLKKMEGFLLKYKNVHFQIIKHLYSLGRSLENEPIGKILKFPTLLDFETKKFLFRRHPKIRKSEGRFRLAIEVSRANIFQDSYNQIMNKTPKQLMGRLQVTFIDEPGYDAGGIAREWFESLSKQIFNADYALFEPSSSGNTYRPNPKSYVNPDHLLYFKFIGRFVAKALAEGMLIDSYFIRAFYKIILGQELEFQDLEQQDYPFYKSMLWIKSNKIEGIMEQNFSYLYDNFGHRVVKEIIPGGRAIPVTEENKPEYIEKYCLTKMRDQYSLQMNSFMEGFHDIIPDECISFFEAKQLQLLISGLPSIDIEDMKANTDYSGYIPGEQVIQWYWEIIEGYSQDELAKLVQFITGTSRIPAGGFSQLQGMNGLQRISIHKDPNSHQLPKSHTCFNQLDLPNYHSKDILRERLRIAITEGYEGFGFM